MRKILSQGKTSITKLTKGKLPSLPLKDIKEIILGKNYELSITFVGRKLSEEINKKYRKKNKPTDILSFPLSKKSGELIINLEQVRLSASFEKKNYLKYLGYIVIHGLLHLKGLDHSSTMERKEDQIKNRFNL